MARVRHIKKARKDIPGYDIKRGDSYYYWRFAFDRHKYCSKTPPTRSQLTKSAFKSSWYDFQDNFKFTEPSELESELDSLRESIQEFIDQCQESLDNMVEHLKDTSNSGMMLQERIDELESFMSEIDNVDPSELEDNIEYEAEEDADETTKGEAFMDAQHEKWEEMTGDLLSNMPDF